MSLWRGRREDRKCRLNGESRRAIAEPYALHPLVDCLTVCLEKGPELACNDAVGYTLCEAGTERIGDSSIGPIVWRNLPYTRSRNRVSSTRNLPVTYLPSKQQRLDI